MRETVIHFSLLAAAALSATVSAASPAMASTADAAAACGSEAVDPFALYGDEIRFEVLRNGTPVGGHTVSFGRQGERITTTTRFEVAVDVLFFTAYRYVYASDATWNGSCLLELKATTDDNGDRTAVSVKREGPRLVVSGPEGMTSTGLATLPTEHWIYGAVGRDAVINTITGRVNAVEVEPAGAEAVRTADGRAISARRYVYAGELQNEVWYDAEGRWVKMRFPAKDGSTIEYVCVTCGTGPAAS